MSHKNILAPKYMQRILNDLIPQSQAVNIKAG